MAVGSASSNSMSLGIHCAIFKIFSSVWTLTDYTIWDEMANIMNQMNGY